MATLWHLCLLRTLMNVSVQEYKSAICPHYAQSTISRTIPQSDPCTHNPATKGVAPTSAIMMMLAGAGLSIRRAPLVASTRRAVVRWSTITMQFTTAMHATLQTCSSSIAPASRKTVPGVVRRSRQDEEGSINTRAIP